MSAPSHDERFDDAVFVTTPVYSDAYIADRGDEFIGLGLYEHGVSFLQYLADPERYRQAFGASADLLPAQRRVQQRLDSDAAAAEAAALDDHPAAERRGGAYVEPLRRHRFPKRKRKARFLGGKKP